MGYETRFMAAVATEDQKALEMWKTNQSGALEFLTASAEQRGNDLVKDWLAFYQKLFIDFRDGGVPRGMRPGYSQDWYDRIARETGDKYMVPDGHDMELNQQKLCVMTKMGGPTCTSSDTTSTEAVTVV